MGGGGSCWGEELALLCEYRRRLRGLSLGRFEVETIVDCKERLIFLELAACGWTLIHGRLSGGMVVLLQRLVSVHVLHDCPLGD